MTTSKPTYQELERRLAAAEPIIEALKRHQVDAVMGEEKIAFLLLSEVGEELLSTEAGFRAMFNLPGVGMIQADSPAFQLSKVNGKFCEMTGYSSEELLAKTYVDLTHPLDRPRDMKELARVLRGKVDSWSVEKRCVRKDGSAIRVAVDGVALRNEAGRVVKILAMIRAIAGSKQSKSSGKPKHKKR